MTQSSGNRVATKLNAKKKPQSHPQNSFAQMVSQAQLNALKPYIDGLVNQAAQRMVSTIFQTMMQERAQTQARQLAFERLLKANTPWFNEEVLALAVAEVEDESSGYAATEEPAQDGDKLRLKFQAREFDKGEFGSEGRLAVDSLNKKGPSGAVQTNEAFEKALVGMKAGETREFLIPEPVEDGKEPENTRIKATIIRVSRRPQAPAAPVAEAAPAAEETAVPTEEAKGE